MEDNSSETSGTPGYMSPEVINSKNHSFPADYFALGVIGYEFMKGERPYKGKNRKEIKDQINERQAEITLKEIIKNNYESIEGITEGDNWSKESISFINHLLRINPKERLGYKSINELKEHLWLKYYPWNLMYNKTLPSPFIPNDKGNFDEKYCQGFDYIGEETKLRYEEILNAENYDSCFKDFYYNIDEDKKRNEEIISLQNSKEVNKKIYNEKSQDKKYKKLSIDNNYENKIYLSRSKNKNKKLNERSIKINENKKSNFILINFNINNITNNNIERKKINNFFFNNKNNAKNMKSNKLKNIIDELNNKNHITLKSDLSFLNFNNNYKNISPKMNFSLRLNDSRIKNKNNKQTIRPKFYYNNSLIYKYNKNNSSRIELIQKKNLNKKENKKKIQLNIAKNKRNRSDILSLSFREKHNNYTNFIKFNQKKNNLNTLNGSLRPSSHSRIINKINQKLINLSLKNTPSMANIKPKKILFNKKFLNNNVVSKKNNISKNSIPISHRINHDYLKNNETNKTLQNKGLFLNKSIFKNKKS